MKKASEFGHFRQPWQLFTVRAGLTQTGRLDKVLEPTKKKGPPNSEGWKKEGKCAYEGQNEDKIPLKKFCIAKKSQSTQGLRER
jgi:hypothetical protein